LKKKIFSQGSVISKLPPVASGCQWLSAVVNGRYFPFDNGWHILINRVFTFILVNFLANWCQSKLTVVITLNLTVIQLKGIDSHIAKWT